VAIRRGRTSEDGVAASTRWDEFRKTQPSLSKFETDFTIPGKPVPWVGEKVRTTSKSSIPQICLKQWERVDLENLFGVNLEKKPKLTPFFISS